jgi:hypothetical protein
MAKAHIACLWQGELKKKVVATVLFPNYGHG